MGSDFYQILAELLMRDVENCCYEKLSYIPTSYNQYIDYIYFALFIVTVLTKCEWFSRAVINIYNLLMKCEQTY